jgi:hypothetical protein
MRFIIIAITSIILFFPAFWLFSQVVGDNWGAGIAAVAMYLAFPILMMKVWPETKKRHPDAMYEALVNGTLSSADYSIEEAVEIEEYEDEGQHYLLDIGNAQTLSLSGQYLNSLVEAGKFSSSRIRVYWDTAEGCTFGIECLGAKILPSETLKPLTEAAYDQNIVPADREVLDQPLRKVVEILIRRA